MPEKKKRIKPNEEALRAGIGIVNNHSLFRYLYGQCRICSKQELGKNAALSHASGIIELNRDVALQPQEWAYLIAHCMLHYAFGHFDKDHMPGYDMESGDGTMRKTVQVNSSLWNMACDICVTRFLADIKFGKTVFANLTEQVYMGKDEHSIYEYLIQNGVPENLYCGTALPGTPDMLGLDKPLEYLNGWRNRPTEQFARALANSVSQAVSEAGGYDHSVKRCMTFAEHAANWFVNHYPLLGGLASGFRIVEDVDLCIREEISVAAINVMEREIYVNPAADLDEEELKFVLAHEYLHAGLEHHERCKGRDRYLWNVACDYVINGWLNEMHIGEMPKDGILYDPDLSGKSAEEIYDLIVQDIRKYRKLATFRGYGKGDVIGNDGFSGGKGSVRVDEFCKNALRQGLEYHLSGGRGFIPAGLVQEIRALAVPPIPWDVELGKWFDMHFKPLDAKRTYARPSRRQGSTPDILRPRYVPEDVPEYSRTFGVVVDTSGSMSASMIGYALGAIASYSSAKDVPYARVVFCDACAYDAGYISPDDIAGRVEVKGRGGTVLQPGVDLLIHAKDFPKDAPILIITDGVIESDLVVKRKHAFLLPQGKWLPFRAKGDVFYYENRESVSCGAG